MQKTTTCFDLKKVIKFPAFNSDFLNLTYNFPLNKLYKKYQILFYNMLYNSPITIPYFLK